jgi:hypothetical protein
MWCCPCLSCALVLGCLFAVYVMCPAACALPVLTSCWAAAAADAADAAC